MPQIQLIGNPFTSQPGIKVIVAAVGPLVLLELSKASQLRVKTVVNHGTTISQPNASSTATPHLMLVMVVSKDLLADMPPNKESTGKLTTLTRTRKALLAKRTM